MLSLFTYTFLVVDRYSCFLVGGVNEMLSLFTILHADAMVSWVVCSYLLLTAGRAHKDEACFMVEECSGQFELRLV